MTSRSIGDLPRVSATVIDPDTVRIGGSEFSRVSTCRDFGGEEGTNGEHYDFACSACGFCCDLPEPNYCPGCGAKVVDE